MSGKHQLRWLLSGAVVMAVSSQKWRLRHILIWIVLASLVCWWRGPSFLRAIEGDFFPYGQTLYLPDFVQEWASARNRFTGLPIYTPQTITVERYLGLTPNPNDPYFIDINAHPPTAVLLGVPFAALDFADAFALWNMLSLVCLAASAWLIVEQLGAVGEKGDRHGVLPSQSPFSPWALLPAVALLLTCYPLYHQMLHGQLNLVLLLLLTGVWAADRQGHPRWAGALLGLATAIKFYPGYLFLYFVLRRDWPAIRAGLLALAAITGLTAVVLGPEAYSSYFLDVLPRTGLRRADWVNESLSGLWCKLFDPPLHLPPVQVQPLVESRALAVLGMIGTLLGVSGVLAIVVPRRLAAKDTDLALGLTMIGMLLVSPITWDHYLVVLAPLLAVLWQRLRSCWIERIVLVLLLAPLWVPPRQLMEIGLRSLATIQSTNAAEWWVATPLGTLTALSIPCYALVGLFLLALHTTRRGRLVEPVH